MGRFMPPLSLKVSPPIHVGSGWKVLNSFTALGITYLREHYEKSDRFNL